MGPRVSGKEAAWLESVPINITRFHPDYFFLMGIPGLEGKHLLISIPFFVMYVLALIGNFSLIVVIYNQKALHQPMYIFLTMLATCDIIMSSCSVPKTLGIFWFKSHKISYNGCLTQVFFVHFTFAVEAGFLVCMAYDRYYAICHPLTYATRFTPSLIFKLAMWAVIRGFCIIFPVVFILKRLAFRQSNIIQHTYCEHMALAKLATVDITVNAVYGITIAFVLGIIDVTLIIISYTVIISAVRRLPSSNAGFKALNTCVSHVCVIVLFYVPAYFSFIAHRVGHKHISLQFHIIFANFYILFPPMMNPIIYGMKTNELRQQIFAIFTRVKSVFH
ncbi:olfactory receptor 52Z1P-like [Gastrophryne carolinensis]